MLKESLEYVTEIKGFSKVYDGVLSYDGSTLWLASFGNTLYSVSMNDFSVKKIKVEEATNLEGWCCTSFKNNSVFVKFTKTSSVVRKYTTKGEFEEIIKDSDNIFVNHILPIDSENKYLIICKRRNSSNENYEFICYNENNCSFENHITNISFEFFAESATIDEQKKLIYLSDSINGFVCDYQGNIISTGRQDSNTYFSELIEFVEEENKKHANEFINTFINSLKDKEIITSIELDKNNSLLYIATNMQLTVINSKTFVLVDKVKKNGILQIALLTKGNLLVTTGSEIILYMLE